MSKKNDIVMIELDRPRMLWFGHKALKTLTALTGKQVDELEINGSDLEDLEKIFYCGLMKDAKENGETLTIEQMEDLMDYVPFGELMAKLEDAFKAAFGDAAGTEKNEQRIAMKPK